MQLRAGNRSSEPDFGECGLPRFPGGGTGGMNNSIGHLILSAPRLSPLPRRPPFPHQGTTKFSKLKLGF